MATMTVNPTNGIASGFVAGGTIARGDRVKLNGTTQNSVVVAGVGASDDWIGVATEDAASGQPVPVQLRAPDRTMRMMSTAAAIAQNALVYGAASGKISTTSSGNAIGWAMNPVGSGGGMVEVLPRMTVAV